MIIQNGFLFTYDTTGGGMLHGIPQKVETKMSDKGIPCNIVKTRATTKARTRTASSNNLQPRY